MPPLYTALSAGVRASGGTLPSLPAGAASAAPPVSQWSGRPLGDPYRTAWDSTAQQLGTANPITIRREIEGQLYPAQGIGSGRGIISGQIGFQCDTGLGTTSPVPMPQLVPESTTVPMPPLTPYPSLQAPPQLPPQMQSNSELVQCTAASAPASESEEGIGAFFEGAIIGDYSDNNSWSKTAGQVVMGVVPIAGQIADVRDTTAAIGKIWRGEEGGWADLGLSVVGFVPLLGDGIKAAVRGGSKAIDAGTEVAEQVAKSSDEVASEAAEQATKSGDDVAGEGAESVNKSSDEAGDTSAKTPDDVVRKQITLEGGSSGNWSKELNARKLEPNADYHVNGYHYATDGNGRVTQVEGKLDLKTADRNEYQQKVAGREDRLETDQGGHLIASIFNGPGERLNLVAMDGNVNMGAWKSMENKLAKALEAGKVGSRKECGRQN